MTRGLVLFAATAAHLLPLGPRQQVKRSQQIDGLQADAGCLQLGQVAALAGQQEQERLPDLAHARSAAHPVHIPAPAESLQKLHLCTFLRLNAEVL